MSKIAEEAGEIPHIDSQNPVIDLCRAMIKTEERDRNLLELNRSRLMKGINLSDRQGRLHNNVPTQIFNHYGTDSCDSISISIHINVIMMFVVSVCMCVWVWVWIGLESCVQIFSIFWYVGLYIG